MLLYRGYSLLIGSDLALPELPEAEGEPDVLIRLGGIPRIPRKATLSDELSLLGFAGAFHVRNGREIVVDPLPGVNIEAVQALLLGRIMAYLLRQRGWLPLHASGVIVNGSGALFLGASGSGKSTVAAAFHASGHQVITDDVAAVRASPERCIALPGRPRLRLHDDSRALLEGLPAPAMLHYDKYLVDVSRGAFPKTVEVKRIYVIADGDEIGTQPIAPTPAVRFLTGNSFFRRWLMDTASLTMHFHHCAAVAGTTASIRRLTRPMGLSALPALVRFVEKDLASNG
jgi:hypothetical protein